MAKQMNYYVIINLAASSKRFMAKLGDWKYHGVDERWARLDPTKVEIFSSYRTARKVLAQVRKGKRYPSDYEIERVQLCLL